MDSTLNQNALNIRDRFFQNLDIFKSDNRFTLTLNKQHLRSMPVNSDGLFEMELWLEDANKKKSFIYFAVRTKGNDVMYYEVMHKYFDEKLDALPFDAKELLEELNNELTRVLANNKT